MLTAAAAFLLLLIALLAIPVTLRFQLSWRQGLRDDLRLRWAFGLISLRIRSARSRAPSPEDEGREPRVARAKPATRKKRNFFGAFRQASFRRRIIRFVGELWRAVHKENINLRVRLGLGDPAETGQLWAFVGPVAGLLASVRGASIRIEPDFFDATFELDTSGSIRLIPLQMIYLVLALLLSPPFWQGMRQFGSAGR
jgi:hypothetical protein